MLWTICRLSGWWFQISFIFTPIWGRFPILTNIFQRGWNHQPVMLYNIATENLWLVFSKLQRKYLPQNSIVCCWSLNGLQWWWSPTLRIPLCSIWRPSRKSKDIEFTPRILPRLQEFVPFLWFRKQKPPLRWYRSESKYWRFTRVCQIYNSDSDTILFCKKSVY